MADHDIRREAKLFQRLRGVRDDLRAPHGGIQFPRRDVRLLRRGARLHVGNLPHPLDHVRVGFGDEDDLMRLHRHQMAHEMKELSWKILVDKKEFQRVIPNGGRRRAGHWLRLFLVRFVQAEHESASLPEPGPGDALLRAHCFDMTGRRANDGPTVPEIWAPTRGAPPTARHRPWHYRNDPTAAPIRSGKIPAPRGRVPRRRCLPRPARPRCRR